MNENAADRELLARGEGQMADLARQYFGHFLDLEQARIIEQMKANYRVMNHDPVTLASSVAALCALEDVSNRIMRAIKKVRSKTDEELKHAPTI